LPPPPSFSSPLLLGFERLERVLDRAAKGAVEGYPPYNIERIGENGLRITLAVAGFALEDLAITLEDKQLVIRGRKQEDDTERMYLHRGIASRQFQRSFALAEGLEVVGANLDNGLLNIDLLRPVPEPEVQSIRITRGSADADGRPRQPQTIDVGKPDEQTRDGGRGQASSS
jgi:HSP20 family molecular chaperone IbpA